MGPCDNAFPPVEVPLWANWHAALECTWSIPGAYLALLGITDLDRRVILSSRFQRGWSKMHPIQARSMPFSTQIIQLWWGVRVLFLKIRSKFSNGHRNSIQWLSVEVFARCKTKSSRERTLDLWIWWNVGSWKEQFLSPNLRSNCLSVLKIGLILCLVL